jgi:uncharacterized protein
MRQIFLLILFVVLGQWLVKALRRAGGQPPSPRPGSGSGAGHDGNHSGGASRASGVPRIAAEPMIRCVECGVHTPASDSVVVAGQAFCCSAHAQRHASRPSGRDAR